MIRELLVALNRTSTYIISMSCVDNVFLRQLILTLLEQKQATQRLSSCTHRYAARSAHKDVRLSI